MKISIKLMLVAGSVVMLVAWCGGGERLALIDFKF
jgi:hypothetical protein